VPKLQTSAQVVAFLSGHLGYPFPSPTLFNQIGQRFRRAVASYADANDIPWVKFAKDDDKLAVMTPHLRRQGRRGRGSATSAGSDDHRSAAARHRWMDWRSLSRVCPPARRRTGAAGAGRGRACRSGPGGVAGCV
jgi:hypothetical protein